jgi:hypothetical protein
MQEEKKRKIYLPAVGSILQTSHVLWTRHAHEFGAVWIMVEGGLAYAIGFLGTSVNVVGRGFLWTCSTVRFGGFAGFFNQIGIDITIFASGFTFTILVFTSRAE